MDIRSANVFRLEDEMPCSLCYGSIGSGLQAVRCACGNISHISCGIKVGKCSGCEDDYQSLIYKVSEEAIIRSVEDSQEKAQVDIQGSVEWDEKEDMMRQLLKKVINNEITVEEYKMLVSDLKETYMVKD